MRLLPLTVLTVLAAGAALDAAAQASASTRERDRRREAETTITRSSDGRFSVMRWDSDRAYLGISTGGGTKRDTIGLLVESVVPNSPAEKAGLEEGNRLVSINGVKLAADAADAGEPETASMMQRRLTRELGKVQQGDNVDLRVWAGGQVKTIKVKTGAPDEPVRVSSERMRDRAVLGIGLGSTSKRDTLGVFVTSVTDGGPAEKAGLVEGDRIAAIDGTDLRVPREDAGDASVSASRMSRLQRILRGKSAGDEVQLRVLSNGRARDLKVKTGKASDLGDREGFRFFSGDEGGMSFFRTPMPAMAPRAPRPPEEPTAPGDVELRILPSRMTPFARTIPSMPLLRGAVRSRTIII